MKKFYNEPEMNISLFEQADIVTASGEGDNGDNSEVTGQTAVEKAKAALTGATTQVELVW
jgi:hypothetical protein